MVAPLITPLIEPAFETLLRSELNQLQNAAQVGMCRLPTSDLSWRLFECIWKSAVKIEHELNRLEQSGPDGG
jgi:hypothetical protein